MNKFVWIRHAEKLYNNGRPIGQGKTYDPGIVDNIHTRNNIWALVEKLVKRLGVPEKIITSPFLRTRQTTELIVAFMFQKYGWTPIIEYSEDISEYLGFCKNKSDPVGLEEETSKHMKRTSLLEESMASLTTRVEKHILNIHKNEKNVWVITHGIVMSKIFNFYNGFEPNRPEPLDYMILEKNKLSAIFQP
jgi:broad specificity phosphatase PhoE